MKVEDGEDGSYDFSWMIWVLLTQLVYYQNSLPRLEGVTKLYTNASDGEMKPSR